MGVSFAFFGNEPAERMLGLAELRICAISLLALVDSPKPPT